MIFDISPSEKRRYDIFNGWIDGSPTVSRFRCQITILEEDPMNWKVMAYFPGDQPQDIIHLNFHVRAGEELTSATTRLAALIRARKVSRAHNEYIKRIEDEEFSIEKDVPYAAH